MNKVKVEINYGNVITVEVDLEGKMRLTAEDGQYIELIPDELQDICQVAGLMQWEGFRSPDIPKDLAF